MIRAEVFTTALDGISLKFSVVTNANNIVVRGAIVCLASDNVSDRLFELGVWK